MTEPEVGKFHKYMRLLFNKEFFLKHFFSSIFSIKYVETYLIDAIESS